MISCTPLWSDTDSEDELEVFQIDSDSGAELEVIQIDSDSEDDHKEVTARNENAM